MPADERVNGDPQIINMYKKWYIGQYCDPKINWDTYNIHHIIPLKYGGTNAMNNLFHLPRDFHQKKATLWWSAY
ncbi:HNH endonuclease [Shouchella clausii]|uniref:HNH endonuclease n=1 Tax=Shouchella clausii TaxID=79880 RepID=UPI000681C609|nr:HNH endonuclease signature motif containing protein [Shouchella clausii]